MLNAKSERRSACQLFADEEAVFLCDEDHFDAELRDLSASGARMNTPVRFKIGKEVFFHADTLGRFESRIARHEERGRWPLCQAYGIPR